MLMKRQVRKIVSLMLVRGLGSLLDSLESDNAEGVRAANRLLSELGGKAVCVMNNNNEVARQMCPSGSTEKYAGEGRFGALVSRWDQ